MDGRGIRCWRMALTLCLTLLAASALPVMAQAPIPGYPTATDAFDPREVALIPRYCIYTQTLRVAVPGGDNPAAVASWYDYFGPTFHHMHHYCVGLMKMNRAQLLAKDTETRHFYLGDAILEIQYVITRAKDDFVLMPEMLTKVGECHVLLGDGPRGVHAFERAIEIKKDYWPAYAQISDYYKSQGDLKKAREALEAGLTSAPGIGALTRRLAELDSSTKQRTQR